MRWLNIWPWGQKVKRRESSVCPGRWTSPLTTKITPQFPDCHQPNQDNPPVHFCSRAFKYVAIPNIFPLQQSSCQNKTNNVTNSMGIFSVKIIQSEGGEEGGREKTDSGMKRQAEGHRISSALHPARSQSRGTAARAKDAQARAKFFSSKQRPPIVPVWPSASLSDPHMDAVLCYFNRKKEKKPRMFAQLPSLILRDDPKMWFWQTAVDHFSSPRMFLFTYCPLGNWAQNETCLFVCLVAVGHWTDAAE